MDAPGKGRLYDIGIRFLEAAYAAAVNLADAIVAGHAAPLLLASLRSLSYYVIYMPNNIAFICF